MFHMCIPCDSLLSTGTKISKLVTLTFDLLFKNFNLDHVYVDIKYDQFYWNVLKVALVLVCCSM